MERLKIRFGCMPSGRTLKRNDLKKYIEIHTYNTYIYMFITYYIYIIYNDASRVYSRAEGGEGDAAGQRGGWGSPAARRRPLPAGDGIVGLRPLGPSINSSRQLVMWDHLCRLKIPLGTTIDQMKPDCVPSRTLSPDDGALFRFLFVL